MNLFKRICWLLFITISVFAFKSCSFEGLKLHEKILTNNEIGKDSIVKAFYYYDGPLGATVPNVLWIRLCIKNDSVIIGKIKDFSFDDSVNIMKIDSSNLKVRLIYTGVFKGHSDYIVNLNFRIMPNDGSPYNERLMGPN